MADLLSVDGRVLAQTSVASLGSVSVTTTTPTWAGGASVLKVPASGSLRMGVIALHGGFSTPTDFNDGSNADLSTTALAAARFPVAHPNIGTTWSNDTAMAKITDAWQRLAALGADMSHGVAVLGLSAGWWNGAVWTAQNRSLVSCMVGFAPASDGDQIQGTALGTSKASDGFPGINEAFGGVFNDETGWDAAKATHDPTLLAAAGAFSGLPYRAWYGLADTTVLPATVETIVGLIGSTASYVQVAGALHTTVTAGVVPAEVVRFVARHYPPVVQSRTALAVA